MLIRYRTAIREVKRHRRRGPAIEITALVNISRSSKPITSVTLPLTMLAG